MRREVHELSFIAVAELLSLSLAAGHRDHHIAKENMSRLRVTLAHFGVKMPRFKLILREAENIRSTVNIAELLVHGMYPLVVG